MRVWRLRKYQSQPMKYKAPLAAERSRPLLHDVRVPGSSPGWGWWLELWGKVALSCNPTTGTRSSKTPNIDIIAIIIYFLAWKHSPPLPPSATPLSYFSSYFWFVTFYWQKLTENGVYTKMPEVKKNCNAFEVLNKILKLKLINLNSINALLSLS